MDTTAALLDAWNRQAEIINNLAAVVDEQIFDVKPSEDGWSLGFHLCHIQSTRKYWLRTISEKDVADWPRLFVQNGEEWEAIRDLSQIREALRSSAESVGRAVEEMLEQGMEPAGPYTNGVIYLQHMLWHEGWHAGLIMLGLRVAGREPTEQWEEKNIWELWRGVEEG